MAALRDAVIKVEVSDLPEIRAVLVRARALEAVFAERERELLELKGPCRNTKCRLHRAHSGPCDCDTGETTECVGDETRLPPAVGSDGTESDHDCRFRRMLRDVAVLLGVPPNDQGLYDGPTVARFVQASAVCVPAVHRLLEECDRLDQQPPPGETALTTDYIRRVLLGDQ